MFKKQNKIYLVYYAKGFLFWQINNASLLAQQKISIITIFLNTASWKNVFYVLVVDDFITNTEGNIILRYRPNLAFWYNR